MKYLPKIGQRDSQPTITSPFSFEVSVACSSTTKLCQFCRQRAIRLLRFPVSREGMIASLERADDEGLTFDGFLDLPTELQSHVYDFYKSSLGSRFGPFSAAPPFPAVVQFQA